MWAHLNTVSGCRHWSRTSLRSVLRRNAERPQRQAKQPIRKTSPQMVSALLIQPRWPNWNSIPVFHHLPLFPDEEDPPQKIHRCPIFFKYFLIGNMYENRLSRYRFACPPCFLLHSASFCVPLCFICKSLAFLHHFAYPPCFLCFSPHFACLHPFLLAFAPFCAPACIFSCIAPFSTPVLVFPCLSLALHCFRRCFVLSPAFALG